MNIFLQLEANPVQMCLLYFYPAVLVNSKLDHYRMCPHKDNEKLRSRCELNPWQFKHHWSISYKDRQEKAMGIEDVMLLQMNMNNKTILSWPHSTGSNISNTRKSVSSDIQTLRSGVNKRGVAEFFLTNFEVFEYLIKHSFKCLM